MTTLDKRYNDKSTTSPHKGAIIYTDGSCRGPNPGAGYTGWGAHGYLYDLVEPNKPTLIDNHVLTNKGYCRVGHLDGAKHVEPTSYIDFLGSSLIIGTNNIAELQAACHSLERMTDQNLNYINIYTDSEYVRKGLIDWCKGWERHNWRKPDGSYVPNHEWWIRLYTVYQEMRNAGTEISVDWVKGHNEVFGNTHADILAGMGTNYSIAKELINQFKFTPAKGYWKTDIERNPMLNLKRLYFNSVDRYNVPGHYFQADSGGADVAIGNRLPETGLSIVRLNTPDIAVEAVKQRQYEIAKETNAIIMMKLDRVYSKEIYPYLSEHGKYSLLGGGFNHKGNGNLNVNFFDKKPVTVEQNPTGLSMRAIESFNLLEDLLDKFLHYRAVGYDHTANNIQLNGHDITEVFYSKEERISKKDPVTKYALKPEYVVGYRDMTLSIVERYEGAECDMKVPIVLGMDILPRNNLKKLEELNPSVYLITWRESRNSLRYATIIECDDGIGIWSNFFADKIYFYKPTT